MKADNASTPTSDSPLLEVCDLSVEYPVGRTGAKLSAVDGLSLAVARGETLGLVGESGCGKSTTGRAIMQLPRPTRGSVIFEGTDLTTLRPSALRQARTRMQMIFQDPISSLNPRRKVRDVVMEPLSIWNRGTREERVAAADALLEEVGIDPQRAADSYAYEFSGGQCQRISIARALAMRPSLIICDEPVSALDVSVQAQVLNLLEDLKLRHGLTLVFIAHDLSVVKNVSDRVAVMYLGRICEIAPSDHLYRAPAHHYTSALLASIPVPDPHAARERRPIQGEPPSPIDPPPGCRFHTRCPAASALCRHEQPPLRALSNQHYVACHHPLTEHPVQLSSTTSAAHA